MKENAFDRAVKAALCDNLARRLLYVPDSVKRQTTEIRLRTGRPLMLTTPVSYTHLDVYKRQGLE